MQSSPTQNLSENIFSADELLRYSRHFVLPQFGEGAQRLLKQARVLIVGAGGLGSPAALYLAAAGVGTIGLVDADVVDASNLQRQILYGTSGISKHKLSEARVRLRDLNPHINVVTHEIFLSSANALDILKNYDVILDGTDNFATRYLVNDACVLLQKPNVYGSIFRFDGQASVFDARRGPCYRCLYSEPPDPGSVPSCAEGGVLGVLPGIIGVIQATEAIKLITNIGEPLIGRLLLYNALDMRFHELSILKNPACPICGEHPTIDALIDYDEFCGIPKMKIVTSDDSLSVEEFYALKNSSKKFVLIDVREPFESAICTIGGTLVPLRTLPSRTNEFNADDDIIVYCHSGMRSAEAVRFLRANGFTHARNLIGGIEAWRVKFAPEMKKY